MGTSTLTSSGSLGGKVIGSYVVEGWLGSGGMGDVYLARHLRTHGTFAIKVLRRTIEDHELGYVRLRAEALIASALRHPHIVQVVDLGELPDGRPYLVMEHLLGQDLEQRLREGPLPLPQALTICRQIASGLHSAHRNGVVHGDIKPSNIFLMEDEATGQLLCKIIDFGVSRMHGLDSGGDEQQVLGTPCYMPPEVRFGARHSDGRSDQYALALVLCHMLGARPRERAQREGPTVIGGGDEGAPSLSTLREDLPFEVESALRRALSPRKEDRFPTVRDFIHALMPSAETPLPPAAASLPPPPSGSRALIVDDDQDLRALLQHTLHEAGWTCRVLDCGEQALRVAREFRPQLALLDVMLPGKSGFKLCWELKALPELRGVRVLLMSGKTAPADHYLGQAMGADGYIDKPFDVEALLGLLRAAG